MTIKLLVTLIISLSLVQCSRYKTTEFKVSDHVPYGVCYTKLTAEQLQPFKMMILDTDSYTADELDELSASGTDVIGYLSLGEVDVNRWYYPLLDERGFVGKNENWNSFYLDLEDRRTRELLLKEVIPKIMAKGPQGLFLDTVDAVAPETEQAYLKPYMIELIREIRQRYPAAIIIQNAGLFLIEETASYIDAFMTESLASDYDFGNSAYKIRTDEEYESRLKILNGYAERAGKPYFILDYADTPEGVKEIKTRLDTLGRPFYISTIGLNQLPDNVFEAVNAAGQGE